MLIVNRFTKVTNDSILQSAGSINVIWIGSNEDCRNRVLGINEAPVEFDPGHRRHMDVSDEASCLREMRRCEEIGCRQENLNGVILRSHEPSHRLATKLIILNDRDQWRFKTSGILLEPVIRAPLQYCCARMRIPRPALECSRGMLVPSSAVGHRGTLQPMIPELPFGGYHSSRIDPGVRYPPYSRHAFERKVQAAPRLTTCWCGRRSRMPSCVSLLGSSP
jgi:hypothetical protein